MNNARDTAASREEEIAFLILEQVLGVQVGLADAGGGDSVPDGRWVSGNAVCIVEVTSPPSAEVMRAFAQATRAGERYIESGSAPAHLTTLANHLSDLVSNTLVRDVEKLAGATADERHLFLLGRSVPDQEYFARLSDEYGDGFEQVDPLALPAPVTDVWFLGRAERDHDKMSGFTVRVARFNATDGWRRHEIRIDEQALPSPTIVKDPAPAGWRSPERRA